MKILAIEKDLPGSAGNDFEPHLEAEAARIWELQQSGVLREAYFRADAPEAVLVLECGDSEEAKEILSSLPLVRAGLIAFEVIPLRAYPGLSRLFKHSRG